MSGIVKVAVFVLIWEFSVGLMVIIANTALFGYIIPVFDDMAATADFVDNARYQANTLPIKMGINVALFIFAILPFVYLLVRLFLKREQTAPPAYAPPAWSYPGVSRISRPRTDNFTGGLCHVRL